jgi:hypothetical protein
MAPGTVSEQSSSVADRQWQIELDLTAGQRKAGTMRATDPDLDCTSAVTVTAATATSASLRAPVKAADNPRGSCSSLGLIALNLNPSADTLAITWQDTEDPTNFGTATPTR